VDILIEDDFDLTPYGVEARTLHTPGHTPGSISIITNDGRALVGDLIGGGWPLGQFQPGKPRYHYWASDLADVKTSLERILSFTPSRIYAGHGGPLDGQAAIEFFKPEQALTKA
jgi:glyoxylase-like metal-dependent hydrolase (beta-lactamase superfamily II)